MTGRPRRGKKQNSFRLFVLLVITVVALAYIGGWVWRSRSRSTSTQMQASTKGQNDASSEGVLTREDSFEGKSSTSDKETLYDISNDADENRVKERAKAAVLGAFVADAATMGLHWIYNTAQIQALLTTKQKIGSPEFFEPPSCPFYKYDSGNLSPYGDEVLPLLESVVEQGRLDPHHFSKHLFESFKKYNGRLNSASKDMVRNLESGKQFPEAGAVNDEAHSIVKASVVVARYAGKPNLKDVMLDTIRVHQQSTDADDAGVAAALVLERIVLGQRISQAIQWALQDNHIPTSAKLWLQTAVQSKHTNAEAAVLDFGQSCHLPGSFQGPMFLASHSNGYVEAVRENIMAGGDNCSRAHFIGALFAAQDGLDSIPDEWRQKTAIFTDLEALVDDLLERRGAL
ncbi:hypothetical protein BSKO_12890 [Bryopsis sp. KO-2023]|nr:hypothetical protein BSKO_12890 [Bryopsis sp. KO-2023]